MTITACLQGVTLMQVYMTIWRHDEYGVQRSVYYTPEGALDWQQYVEYVHGRPCRIVSASENEGWAAP